MAVAAAAPARDQPADPHVPGAGSRRALKVVDRPEVRQSPANSRGRRDKKWVSVLGFPAVRVTGALLVVSTVVFGLVLLHIHVAQTSFHLSDLQRRAGELQTEQLRLRYELARAESPEKVAEMSNSLGLVPPDSRIYLQGPSVSVSDQGRDLPSAYGGSYSR